MAHSTVDTLNALVGSCKDGEFGFRSAAEHATDPDLQQLFVRRADEHRQYAIELQQVVMVMGATAEDASSAGGVAQRGWTALKGMVAGYTDLDLLENAERGEDQSLAAYRAALADPLPPAVLPIVERQFEAQKRHHARIRQLRDQARAAKA